MHHEFDRALSEGFVTHISHFQLRRQPTHPSDPSAVAIYTGRFKIGYVPVRHVQKIAEELDRGDHFGITLSGYYPYKIIFEQLELRLTNQTLQSSLSQPAF
ncbi:HIRAN domain-containing protein [Arundinibacter roseus]|uniref:HIRAN domain-containing protein n=1 Tax=Arundinibacter roseus TaxID=2070510 RepID=A0A4R4K376_9BACT|nr:HIRAN domain-containing protein [Arundinibacter roseus]TDB61827.1 hypothetical protein EZE20_18965 [Arundinibacter roseus]